MKLLLGSSIVLFALQAVSGSAHGEELFFDKLRDWLVSEGGEVNRALYGGQFRHGTAEIRGVGTKSNLAGDYKTTLFTVPKKLWMVLGNFPTFEKAVLPVTPACEGLTDWEKYRMKLAAAMVAESHKGKQSFHYLHISSLPKMSEFQSFLPNFMSVPMQKDFAGLPLVKTIQEVQTFDKDYNEVCFKQWKGTSGSPAASVSWDDELLALTWIRTRSYGTDEGTAVVPGTDMLNAAKAVELNTYWSSTPEAFSVHTKVEDVAAGQELYESYCQDCDNSAMLKIWGVYMEDNLNSVDSNAMDCSANAGLKGAMESVLDMKSVFAFNEDKWKSPRCRPEVFSKAQGPMQCSLARLTWEYCAAHWGLASATDSTSATSRTSFLSRSTAHLLNPRDEIKLLSQSSIGNVPHLLKRSIV